MEAQTDMMKRQVAYKLPLNAVAQGSYFKVDTEPNYLVVNERYKVSRVNVMGIVIDQDSGVDSGYSSFKIDDSTGKITVRIFSGNDIVGAQDATIGTMVMVVGKPREYNNEIYIVPEIIRKIENPLWLKHRKLELDAQDLQEAIPHVVSEATEAAAPVHEAVDTEVMDVAPTLPDNPYEKYLSIIRELDQKDGAPAEEVVARISALGQDGEQMVDRMLKEGEIFEIKAGRIKILS